MPESYKNFSAALMSGPAFCSAIVPRGEFVELNRAMVCGDNLPPSLAKQLFVDTGLIHLMVVSGSHLVFWEQILFFLPARVRLTVLATYCYVTGFQPPVVLAFTRRLIARKTSNDWGWTSLQREFLAVLIILIAFPDWLLSRSLLMSWACGLALASPPWLKGRPFLDPSLKIYFFLLPFCWMEPVTIFWNAVLAPVVGVVLFPVSLLSIFISALQPACDGLWNLFLQLLAAGPKAAPLLWLISTGWLWPWPLGLHLAFILGEIRWRRAFAYSPS